MPKLVYGYAIRFSTTRRLTLHETNTIEAYITKLNRGSMLRDVIREVEIDPDVVEMFE